MLNDLQCFMMMKILFLGACPDMIIISRYTNRPDVSPFVYWNQTCPRLSKHRTSEILFFALSAVSMYTQNVQTWPSLPPMARAWYKTVTSLSFDWKGLFTSLLIQIVVILYLYWIYFAFSSMKGFKKKKCSQSPRWYLFTKQNKTKEKKTNPVNAGWIKTVCLPKKQKLISFDSCS